MTKSGLGKATMATLLILLALPLLFGQNADQWRRDIDALTSLIETYHPRPWEKIARARFLAMAEEIKTRLSGWSKEKTVLELMALIAAIQDGHSEILLIGNDSFNLWFPLRIEKFQDGFFITACEASLPELLGAKVEKLGKFTIAEAFQKVSRIAAKDSELAAAKPTVNFLVNGVILAELGITENSREMSIQIISRQGEAREVRISSAPWKMNNLNWSWRRDAVPTDSPKTSIYDDQLSHLPHYLSKMVPDRIPYWYQYFPEERLLFFQFNAVTNWSKEPFSQFTEKLFRTFDENSGNIDKVVIDLRFNEGGNGYLLPSLVQEFILRRDLLKRGKLFAITGSRTFSAAPNLIGQLLKYTELITVGDIAPGPLNWCSDTMDFTLPESGLTVELSTMFWMTGHATDNRGYYPPEIYVPETFADLIVPKDRALETILAGNTKPLKDSLKELGWAGFWERFQKLQSSYPDVGSWFPYTNFDLLMAAFFNLLPAGKSNDACLLMKFATELYPEKFRAWYGLAEAAKASGDVDAALAAYDHLTQSDPLLLGLKRSRIVMELHQSFLKAGQDGLARLFAKRKNSDPDWINEHTLNNLGYGFLQNGKTADAIKIFKLNQKFYPAYANGYDSLGEACHKAGDRKGAIRAYKQALQLDPGISSVREALKKLGVKTGKEQK